ncbi:MAG: oxidoreductase [Lysobacteraceae bacterium]|nr:MAG: oxidoreductase [Xanthomonadaceae bacterium]
MKVTINGAEREFSGDQSMPILWFLRDELQMTGTKFGCGKALCGACTVHLDGQPTRACVTPMAAANGRSITTIEGLDGSVGEALKGAWKALNVPQCGYCQSGQLMQAASLLNDNPSPEDADIDQAMAGNICRCGTYPRIRAAIKMAAEGKS